LKGTLSRGAEGKEGTGLHVTQLLVADRLASNDLEEEEDGALADGPASPQPCSSQGFGGLARTISPAWMGETAIFRLAEVPLYKNSKLAGVDTMSCFPARSQVPSFKPSTQNFPLGTSLPWGPLAQ
jgi:hypothetical protein